MALFQYGTASQLISTQQRNCCKLTRGWVRKVRVISIETILGQTNTLPAETNDADGKETD